MISALAVGRKKHGALASRHSRGGRHAALRGVHLRALGNGRGSADLRRASGREQGGSPRSPWPSPLCRQGEPQGKIVKSNEQTDAKGDCSTQSTAWEGTRNIAGPGRRKNRGSINQTIENGNRSAESNGWNAAQDTPRVRSMTGSPIPRASRTAPGRGVLPVEHPQAAGPFACVRASRSQYWPGLMTITHRASA